MDNRRRTLNDIISTIFLLDFRTILTVLYFFVYHFIIGTFENTAETFV